MKLSGWRARTVASLKGELQKATEPGEIRDISSAISSIVPWEPMGGVEAQPVRIVGKRSGGKKKSRGRIRRKKAR